MPISAPACPRSVRLETMEDRALLALQGPQAATVLARHIADLGEPGFMTARPAMFDGVPVDIFRSGYTGEDGFEISLAADEAERVARALLAEPEVKPIGLGARDSLRLEAGLCLYGHDIDVTTTPVEADLLFAIPKRRREEGGFPGASHILRADRRRSAAEARRAEARRQGASPRGRRDQGHRPVIISARSPPAASGRRWAGRSRWAMSTRPTPSLGKAVTIEVRGRELPATVVADAVRAAPLLPGNRRLDRGATMTTRYTRDHEWIRLDGDVAVVGITDYAQEQLGDIVYVELPEAGKDDREGRRVLRRRVGQGGERGLRPDLGRGDRGERRPRRPAGRGRTSRRRGPAG